MKKIKIMLSLLFVILLCGCTTKNLDENTTTSTTKAPETSAQAETQPPTNVADTTVEPTLLSAQKYSTNKVIWGPGNTVEHKRPSDPVALQKQYRNLDATFILPDEKKLCLTFDEGYENGFTPSILATLKEKNVKAIFFVTFDFASQNPELIRQIIDDGHVLANHTYRHYTMDEVSIEEATEEVVCLHNYILENFQYEMEYFRFPKGEFSEASLALVQDLGYKSIFWSFAYADWDANNPADPAASLDKITSSTHNGAIYLLHAVSATNADILGDAIDNIHEQGYTFVTKI